MSKILFILTIFLTSLLLESSAAAAPAPAPAPASEAYAGLFGYRDGVNHKSARRFKKHRRSRVSRAKFTCLKKRGCYKTTRRGSHIKDSNCKKRL